MAKQLTINDPADLPEARGAVADAPFPFSLTLRSFTRFFRTTSLSA